MCHCIGDVEQGADSSVGQKSVAEQLEEKQRSAQVLLIECFLRSLKFSLFYPSCSSVHELRMEKCLCDAWHLLNNRRMHGQYAG
jgi:hypothetical protein